MGLWVLDAGSASCAMRGVSHSCRQADGRWLCSFWPTFMLPGLLQNGGNGSGGVGGGGGGEGGVATTTIR